jgi:hypothetical protein
MGRRHYHLALLQIGRVLHKVSSKFHERRYALSQAVILYSLCRFFRGRDSIWNKRITALFFLRSVIESDQNHR